DFIVETRMRHLSVNWVAAFLQRHPYAKLLDVSAAHEREAGLFPQGHHEPWLTSDPNPEFLAHTLQHIQFDDYVLVICRFGIRSHDAATLLESA
ncbi:hypothetical protein, partial [Flavihumibacter cheonanensis]|uniref:hypothetical protein n=1 Tax=Flavihumibacter cheonanensis TaxID=1442385 RepID=UPI001EF8C314